MALPILDGNQSATTLSTIVTGGAHVPAHTVVSLGAQAITDIAMAVRNTAEGTVPTGGIPIMGYNGEDDTSFILRTNQGGQLITEIVRGTVTANVLAENTEAIVGRQIAVGADGDDFNSGTGRVAVDLIDRDGNSIGGVNKPIQVSGDYVGTNNAVALTKAVAIGFNSDEGTFVSAGIFNPVPVNINADAVVPQISGTVTVGNSVTVGSLPVQLSTTTIGGTARLNVTLSSATTVGATVPSYGNLYGGSDGTNLRAILVDSSGRTTVTGSVSILGTPSVTMGAISGTVTANVASTTVTVSALPSGALTTRFGSVTTANTAQITTAVTNANRRYLLCQNLDPSVTVTIGIGFTPTTTQGIQLAAGGGIIMDSFVSTGAVWWLSSSAGSNFSILEG